jgi:UDP-N-acetyl-D-mannosaminuronate dehydrogenase
VERGKVLVVGVGEVGRALAAVLERGFRVLRHDIEPRLFTEPISVMHLCFPFTQRDTYEPIALSYIERFKPQLTIINSTVTPGTTRSIARAAKGAKVAFSPVRGKHARMAEDLLHYTKFIAAPDPATAARAEKHFQRLGMKTRRMTNLETLELAKLAETTYFGLLIVYAQELNRWAETVGGDYGEAIGFFDEIDFLPHGSYHPGFIGGHCVIPNIKLLQQVTSSRLLNALLDSNDQRALEIQADRPSPAEAAAEKRIMNVR